MLDALIINKFLHGVVLELGAIVGPYHLDLSFIHLLSFLGEYNKLLIGLILSLKEKDPRVSLVIINNDQSIFSPTKSIIMRWPKEIQVKELQRPRGGDDTLDRMSLLELLPSYTCTAHTIFLKRNAG